MKKIIKLGLVLLGALLLNACGGGGDYWGIDSQGLPLAVCVNNSQDASIAQATIVPTGSKVKKVSSDAIIRVWHFQNSTEAACLMSGEALIVENKEGA